MHSTTLYSPTSAPCWTCQAGHDAIKSHRCCLSLPYPRAQPGTAGTLPLVTEAPFYPESLKSIHFTTLGRQSNSQSNWDGSEKPISQLVKQELLPPPPRPLFCSYLSAFSPFFPLASGRTSKPVYLGAGTTRCADPPPQVLSPSLCCSKFPPRHQMLSG